MTLVLVIKRWWRNIISPSPFDYLLFTIGISHLLFVKALQGTIMAFIESPRFDKRNPVAVKFISHNVVGFD
jgi:hypothetical protein